MIEEKEQNDGEAGHDDVQIVRPSPPRRCIGHEGLSDDWPKARNLKGREKDCHDPNRSVSVRDKLCNSHSKGDLYSTSQSAEEIATDKIFHSSSCRADDGSDQSETVSDDEEPASSKDVGEPPNNEKGNTEAQGVGQSDPCNVVRWANRCVDQCQRIGWHNPSQIIADIAKT